jgi:hypothetical protein
MKKSLWIVLALFPVATLSSLAQTTGTPSFNAPYRAFNQHEFGATLSFPKNANIGLEGQYRFGYQKFDLGFRGGFVDLGNGAPTDVVVGAEGRTRVFEHTENFPFDGALIVGLAGSFIGGQTVAGINVGGSSTAIISGGLSLGRRVTPKDTQVSIVPYAEPVFYITSGNGRTGTNFALGLGGDFRLSKVFDARVSVGLGDVEGIAFSAVWVH